MADAAVATKYDTSGESAWWAPLVMGIIAILFGILLLAHPAESSIWVAWLIGIYWFIGGVMNLVLMFIDRTQWGWRLVIGLLGLFAGWMVMDAMSKAPLLATIGLAGVYVVVLGIEGIFYGILELVMAFKGAGWGTGILGAISILFGVLLLRTPILAGLALPWVFGVFAVVGGIAAIFMAFRLKNA